MAFHTYAEALRDAAERFRASGVPSPEWDARLLAAELIGCGHMDIDLDAAPIPGFDIAYEGWVARRAAREPLQHILGIAWFGPLELEVGPGVFIPRPETEVLADWGVRMLRDVAKHTALTVPASPPRVVDLCTGSGALAGYVKHEMPEAEVYAVELSDEAFSYAQRNLSRVAAEGLRLVQGDATAPATLRKLDGSVDLVFTNPPYVPETLDLEPEVYHDPHMAVFGGEDGMAIINRLVPRIAELLKPGGRVGIEHDDATSAAVQAVLHADGRFTDIAVLRDLTGTARFVTARKSVSAYSAGVQ